ncbi:MULTISPECIES: hypothetical protein [Photorhabdus]|uniref:Uncharacterized protein n=1 Tax=Photorhabdus bodei TaxID=2029681 RepID=A0AAW6BTN7_9GAMM|nr:MULTISPECIES: hypothetical protein [Photorhabdus]MCT8354261.1 hypothetical protein [Photorhabdus kayaii]MDB6375027.1 hypothetical protein [Photorhabdus bodei]
MIRVFINLKSNLFLCLFSYTENTLLNEKKHYPIKLPSFMSQASNTIRQREFAKQYSLILLKELFSTDYAAVNSYYSVSHGKQLTALLLSHIPEVGYIGVDIEYLYYHRKVRHFMIDYLRKYESYLNPNTDKIYLSTVVFCCMESIYKALFYFQPFTFNIDDYVLEKFDDQLCTFIYVGSEIKLKIPKIHCTYYEIDGSIIAVTLMNDSLVSVLDDSNSLV